jgi:LAS superfamily LD-carboxypeptidase LdcB
LASRGSGVKRLADDVLTGRDARNLVEVAAGQRLLPEVAADFERLAADAAAAGFELRIASAWRSYERQLAIFNGKASGERPLSDDCGRPLRAPGMSRRACIEAILRFSALPGASRHHWGTDLDVYDAGALAAGETLQLSPQEVAPGGVFDPLHCWLDQRIAAGRSYGFYRPYDRDRGGVAPERWHLSHAPLAGALTDRISVALLRRCWETPGTPRLHWQNLLVRRLPVLLRRYVYNVAPPPAF